MLKNKKSLTVAAAFILVAIIFILLKGKDKKEEFIFEQVGYGDIESMVTCTGVINATQTVDVGSRISGTISKLYVDYNDSVHVDKLLCVLDTLILSKEYQDVKARMQSKKAKLAFSKIEFKNAESLYKKQLISNREYLNYKTNYLTDSLDYKSEVALLEKSKATLEYAYIRSPIDGIIIDRCVEEGQTVAANFSTPVLYTIAKDLKSIEILVSVDESDISSIKVGQSAKFTVNAYPDNTFYGVVKEIRLKPKNISNVVTYVVVVNAENKKRLLLPGMTATVDFIINSKKNILLMPKSAVQFKASDEMISAYEINSGKKLKKVSSEIAQIWYLKKDGLDVDNVETGLSDMKNIEIVRCRHLKPGMQIITGIKSGDPKGEGKNKSNQLMTPTSSPPGGGAPPP